MKSKILFLIPMLFIGFKINAAEYKAYQLSTTPIIDGKLDEYQDGQTGIIEGENVKAEFKIMYDKAAIYIAVSVSDSQLEALGGNRDSNQIWRDDSIGFYFNTTENILHKPRDKDFDYAFWINLFETQYDWSGERGIAYNTTWSASTFSDGSINDNSDSDKGYSIEISIPWTSFGIYEPHIGKIYGFDVVVVDYFASDAKKYHFVCDNPYSKWLIGEKRCEELSGGAWPKETERANIIFSGYKNGRIHSFSWYEDEDAIGYKFHYGERSRHDDTLNPVEITKKLYEKYCDKSDTGCIESWKNYCPDENDKLCDKDYFQYEHEIDIGNVTQYGIDGLDPTLRYFFSISAYKESSVITIISTKERLSRYSDELMSVQSLSKPEVFNSKLNFRFSDAEN